MQRRISYTMKLIAKIYLAFIVALLTAGCNNVSDTIVEPKNSIYHWKTTFDINDSEAEFLNKHNIERIYVKMYDVAIEQNFVSGKADIVPIATTKFVSAIPRNVEIVPVVYITIDALRALSGCEAEIAELIVERTLAMCRHNECGEIKEMQLDCDWTSQTKVIYEELCSNVNNRLQTKGIDLSITVRLHQLRESAPPANRGVLMLYNTGQLKNINTKNSILDIADVRQYVKKGKYPIPLDYAYPAFGWGIKFKDDKFEAIVSEGTIALEHEYIREERATATEVMNVKALVEKKLGKPQSGNILYHLDDTQLKNYTDDEITKILAY